MARLYGSGIRYSRQHLYAAYDMAASGETVPDPQALWEKMEGETPLGYVPGTHFAGTFSACARTPQKSRRNSICPEK